MSTEPRRDVIVIGGGAAGVSAAVECLDVRLDVVLVEGSGRVGGQIDEVPHTMRNVVASDAGNEAILGALARHAATLGDRLVLGRPVSRLDVSSGLVEAAGAQYRARCLLVATGSRRRELDAAPDGSFGGDVTYLVEPHLERFAGRPVVVVGGGDSAVLDALELAAAGSPVTLVHRSSELTARPDLVARIRSSDGVTQLAGWRVAGLVGAERLEAVGVSNESTGSHRRLEAGGIVLKLGREKRVELVKGQLEIGGGGGIIVDAAMRTSRPRTFAAGDVTEGAYERVATAMGQGSLAVHSILTSLRADP